MLRLIVLCSLPFLITARSYVSFEARPHCTQYKSCQNNGQMLQLLRNSRFVCICLNNYEGPCCDRPAAFYPGPKFERGLLPRKVSCHGGFFDKKSGKCVCSDSHYSGDKCELVTCDNGGTRSHFFRIRPCICPAGFTGTFCEAVLWPIMDKKFDDNLYSHSDGFPQTATSRSLLNPWDRYVFRGRNSARLWLMTGCLIFLIFGFYLLSRKCMESRRRNTEIAEYDNTQVLVQADPSRAGRFYWLSRHFLVVGHFNQEPNLEDSSHVSEETREENPPAYEDCNPPTYEEVTYWPQNEDKSKLAA